VNRNALILAALAIVQSANANATPPPSIAGHWVGDARLFDKALRAQTAPLATDLRIDQDFAISGRIGEAQIPRNLPVSVTAKRVEYRVILPGPVKNIPQLNKSHLIIIITRNDGDTLNADFHLKSRFSFDLTMRVGHLDVVRAK